MMKVSIVIPTFNREKCVIDLLECLLAQEYKEFEIVVVDQSDEVSFAKREIAQNNKSKIKFYWIPERGRSLAKNYGILFSEGDIIIFCDDDIKVPTNFISTHVATLQQPGIAAVSCRLVEEGDPAIAIKSPLRTTFYGQLINKPYSTCSGYVTSLNGGNMSFRRDVLNQVGFFEEFFVGTSMVEEPDMAFRIRKIGYKLYFNASITINHFPQYNGNIAEMTARRPDWFYYYFTNLCMFYLKYNRLANIPFVFFYCLLVTCKHGVLFKISINNQFKMIKGFFNGLREGKKLSKLSTRNKYYTPLRLKKATFQTIELDNK